MGNDVDVMWCGFWQPHMGKWCWYDVVIGDSTCVIGGYVIGLLITSSGKWCRCDVVISGNTLTYVLPPITTSHRHHFLDDVVKNPITSFPDDVVKNPITSPPIAQVLPPITTSHQHHLPRCCRQLPHHTDIISQMM
jgi:hypothetical protein